MSAYVTNFLYAFLAQQNVTLPPLYVFNGDNKYLVAFLIGSTSSVQQKLLWSEQIDRKSDNVPLRHVF